MAVWDEWISESGSAVISSSRFFEIVIVSVPFTGIGFASGDDAGFLSTKSVRDHEHHHNGIADLTHADISGLSIIAARIFPHQHGMFEYLFGFFEADSMLSLIRSVFGLIPFEFHTQNILMDKSIVNIIVFTKRHDFWGIERTKVPKPLGTDLQRDRTRFRRARIYGFRM